MRAAILTSVLCFLAACAGGPPGPESTPGATRVQCMPLTSCPCSGTSCDFTCQGYSQCMPYCGGGARCGVVDCNGITSCSLACVGGSRCDYVDCRNATSCHTDCEGGGLCAVNCQGATDCSSVCSGGTSCLLYCAHATGCAFTECSGGSGMLSCPGNILVCNRACPSCGDGLCDRIAGETSGSCSEDCHG